MVYIMKYAVKLELVKKDPPPPSQQTHEVGFDHYFRFVEHGSSTALFFLSFS